VDLGERQRRRRRGRGADLRRPADHVAEPAAPCAAITTRRRLEGLRRHHLPATGFVIGERLEGDGTAAQTGLVRA
jgi:hypothetical protein